MIIYNKSNWEYIKIKTAMEEVVCLNGAQERSVQFSRYSLNHNLVHICWNTWNKSKMLWVHISLEINLKYFENGQDDYYNLLLISATHHNVSNIVKCYHLFFYICTFHYRDQIVVRREWLVLRKKNNPIDFLSNLTQNTVVTTYECHFLRDVFQQVLWLHQIVNTHFEIFLYGILALFFSQK